MKNQIKSINKNYKPLSFIAALSLLLIIGFIGCDEDIIGCKDQNATNYDSEADTDCNGCCQYATNNGGNGTNSGNGNLIFWSSTAGFGNITVTVDGSQQNVITIAYTTQPACLSTIGVAFFNLTGGTHTYSAIRQLDGKTWQGDVDVVANQCNRFSLN